MKMIEFLDSERIIGRGYHGNAGAKRAYVHDGVLWMVKFPLNTRNFEGAHLPSYTSSPISEYIGSHIYKILGIPVHDTVLAKYRDKIVVGCKDFTVEASLLDFHSIKNTMDDELISGSFSSSDHGERLKDVLFVIDHAEDFEGLRNEVKERFWDMFVVDAFIRNNDRNNGNWGLLTTFYSKKLAPVFDNGNAFFNKRNPSVTQRRLADKDKIKEDVDSTLSFFTDDEDKHIRPFEYIEDMSNDDCNKAVVRFVEQLDLIKIKDMIQEIPEQAFGLPVMSPIQKEFYITLLETAYEDKLRPVAEELLGKTIGSLNQTKSLAPPRLNDHTKAAENLSESMDSPTAHSQNLECS